MEPEPLLPPAPPLHPAPPTWRRLVRQHWPQYIAVVAIWLLMKWVDTVEPRPRAIYHGSDAEYWQARAAAATDARVEGFNSHLACIRVAHQRWCCGAEGWSLHQRASSTPLLLALSLQYSYPFLEDTVPLWAVPVLTLFLPLAVFVGAYLVRAAAAGMLCVLETSCPLPVQRQQAKRGPAQPLHCRCNDAPGLSCPFLPLSAAPIHQAGWATLEAAHHACLNLVACVFTTGLVANTLKSQVGRQQLP